MVFLRTFLQVLFCAGAFVLLFFSVCVLGMAGYNAYQFANGEAMAMPKSEVICALFLGTFVFFSSLYILRGKRQWAAVAVSSGLVLVLITCMLLIIAGVFNIYSEEGINDITKELVIGSYCLFLFIGVILKYEGVWPVPQRVTETEMENLSTANSGF